MPVVMDAARMARTIARIAHEIVERNRGLEDLALVGDRTRGVPIARRISKAVEEIAGTAVPVGSLDITLYRRWSRSWGAELGLATDSSRVGALFTFR